MRRTMMLVIVAVVCVLFTSTAALAGQVYEMDRYAYLTSPAMRIDLGREYTEGMHFYEYLRSNPVVNRDPTGLWTKIERKGEARANTCAEGGDTWDTLAKLTNLDPSDYQLWVKAVGPNVQVGPAPTPGVIYSVPNKVYLDVGPLRWIPDEQLSSVFTQVWVPRLRRMSGPLKKAGYMLINNTSKRMEPATLIEHLRDADLAEFHMTGHGSILTISTLPAGRYTHHRIAKLTLLGCETASPNADPPSKPPNNWTSGYTPGKTSLWQLNVSQYGKFIGYTGVVDTFSGHDTEVELPGGLDAPDITPWDYRVRDP